MERGFNFKLLVPPRVNPIPGQVSTVKPQEIVEDGGCFMQTLQQGYNKCLDKESNIPFPSMNMVVPTKPTRSGILFYIILTNCKPSQLYSKLFEEVQKVKYWKVKVDSEAVQKDRKLQENKRTIETQRKAIQELQFGNESLSIKLEDQISENDDLQNKNNATRNLCNILKDTFERSAEKIHLFESEREETHHLFMENSETIQNKTLKKQIAIETAKSSELENEVPRVFHPLQINKLKEESENVQRSNEEECKNLLDDLETKATSEAELQKKVQKLHLTATDAVKSKEDTEIKCQNKIADMVALMEKHKNQYDKMVDEKDAELDEKKRKDMEATANRTSLELALSQQNIENDRLKEQLKKEMNERVSGHSYRIRTPPSTGKSVPWGMSTLELDPKSDSSEHNDLLVNNSVTFQIQSPAIQKSPGSTLKLAAMKRMRDAGWTSVTGAEKKKKKTVEKIFA
uniref:Synaptonemal complex protein 1 n=1 Tax=Oncorhynchus kisutch TaxID=8019 RepID=A0A8C7NC37_ONCKI